MAANFPLLPLIGLGITLFVAATSYHLMRLENPAGNYKSVRNDVFNRRLNDLLDDPFGRLVSDIYKSLQNRRNRNVSELQYQDVATEFLRQKIDERNLEDIMGKFRGIEEVDERYEDAKQYRKRCHILVILSFVWFIGGIGLGVLTIHLVDFDLITAINLRSFVVAFFTWWFGFSAFLYVAGMLYSHYHLKSIEWLENNNNRYASWEKGEEQSSQQDRNESDKEGTRKEQTDEQQPEASTSSTDRTTNTISRSEKKLFEWEWWRE